MAGPEEKFKSFSTIHGDLFTEVFNGGTKRSAGSCITGYTTNLDKVNAWIKTSHIYAKMQNVLREKINIIHLLCTKN